MKITKERLKQIIKEELANIKEAYTPVPEDMLDRSPEAAISHLDSQVGAIDDDLDNLMNDLDTMKGNVEDRFEKLKDVLRMMIRKLPKKSNSASAAAPASVSVPEPATVSENI